MSRSDGFDHADIDVGLMADPKVVGLARCLRDPVKIGAAVTLYQAAVLASWKAGARLTAEEALPAWWLDLPGQLIDALVVAKLLDADHRIPEHAFESWFGPARDRREHYRELGARGGKAKASNAAGSSDGSADGSSDGSADGSSDGSTERYTDGSTGGSSYTSTDIPDRPDREGTSRERARDDDWPTEHCWASFRKAWEARGFRAPPTSKQLATLGEIVERRPASAAGWVVSAPPGAKAAEVVGWVFKQCREADREAQATAKAEDDEQAARADAAASRDGQKGPEKAADLLRVVGQ